MTHVPNEITRYLKINAKLNIYIYIFIKNRLRRRLSSISYYARSSMRRKRFFRITLGRSFSNSRRKYLTCQNYRSKIDNIRKRNYNNVFVFERAVFQTYTRVQQSKIVVLFLYAAYIIKSALQPRKGVSVGDSVFRFL